MARRLKKVTTFTIQKAYRSRPVVIQVGHFVSQRLEDFCRPTTAVIDDVVRRRIHRSLPHGLADQKEVVPLRQGHNGVKHRSRWRIHKWVALPLEEARINPLSNDDEREGNGDLVVLEHLLNLFDFGFSDLGEIKVKKKDWYKINSNLLHQSRHRQRHPCR